jgi:Lar family restriction alleviation protein
MNSELLPCPFCGGKAILQSEEPTWLHYYHRYNYVKCEVCMARSKKCDTEEQAVNAWNYRTKDPT